MGLRRVILVAIWLLVTWVANAETQSTARQRELSAAAQGGGGAVDVEGTLLLPPTVKRVRTIITVLQWGAGTWVYDDLEWRALADGVGAGFLRLAVRNHGGPENPLELPPARQAVRNAALGGAEAVGNLLAEFARQTGHAELQDAKLLFWGHSAAGTFGSSFAAVYPARTIAFIRYHSHARNVPVDMPTIASVPALIFAGKQDTTAGVEDSEVFWKSGRHLNAPWTFAVEPDATHGSAEAVKAANRLALPWVRAVLALRVPEDATDLRQVGDNSVWLAGASGEEIAPGRAFRGSKSDASWLPDEASAKGWRVVTTTPAK